MTQKEILAMQPGRELNIQVAEKVMGLVIADDEIFGYMERRVTHGYGSSVWGLVGDYSEDIAVAELVVEKMIERGYKDAVHWADFGEGKYTEAEAICKAALLAVLEEHNLEVASDEILRQALGDEENKSI